MSVKCKESLFQEDIGAVDGSNKCRTKPKQVVLMPKFNQTATVVHVTKSTKAN